ncbi:FAD binding domain protein [Microdochium trichocladiopsis]|uniref:FAD binding domain protein n=1 Tax=Microdochium trichocladiopsis TaxID=1682393 RepID=A0A9P8XU78_9PEZI|nr:FAD binding domain protein [Microdochium trichocladiopsis]KAH7014646.1 FAD binding domain protein [Microdochium trichocladiopsis]
MVGGAILLALSTAAVLGAVAAGGGSGCRCRPREPCWPSAQAWQGLNRSVDGALVGLKPFSFPCHDPNFDAAACDSVRLQSNGSIWRASNPGGVQWENWDALPAENQTCYVHSARGIPCRQGRVPVYAVLARRADHVQEAVRFAAKNNIKLVIKNSGHDYLGRSAGRDSLQISTYRLKNIAFTDNFVTKGPHGREVSHGAAVHVGGGVGLRELYNAVGERNLVVVAGLSHTVAAAGGYVQGGGHSPLGAWKGMGSDNALEFEVVTAEGKLVIANDQQNSDLFWALRGGGGGTFGVVTRVTLRTWPDVPIQRTVYGIEVPRQYESVFWAALADFHHHLVVLNDAGGAGYYDIKPSPLNATAPLALSGILQFANRTDTAAIQALCKPLQAAWNATLAGVPGAWSYFVADKLHNSTRDMFNEYLPKDRDTLGGTVILTSRLVSRELLSTQEGAVRLSDTLSRLKRSPSRVITGHVVAGGAPAGAIRQQGSGGEDATGLNPAWRRTLTHLTAGRGWDPAVATWEEQRAIMDSVTNGDGALLRALEPDMGAYLNEADVNEPNFQQAFWGSHYPRLLRVKQRWDPRGLFIVKSGVGSEGWDADGLCRLK